MSKYTFLIFVFCSLVQGIDRPNEALLKALYCGPPKVRDLSSDSVKAKGTFYRCDNMYIEKVVETEPDGTFYHENFSLYGITHPSVLERMKTLGKDYVQSSKCGKMKVVLNSPETRMESYPCQGHRITLSTQKRHNLTDYTIGTWKKDP